MWFIQLHYCCVLKRRNLTWCCINNIFYCATSCSGLNLKYLWNKVRMTLHDLNIPMCSRVKIFTVYRVLHIFCPGNKDQFFKEEVSLNSSPMPQAWPNSKLSNYITVFYFEGLFYSSGEVSPFRFKMQT